MRQNTITVNTRPLGWLWANIIYHVEHHAVPRVPSFNLRKVHEIFMEEELYDLTARFPMDGVWSGRGLADYLRARRDNARSEHQAA